MKKLGADYTEIWITMSRKYGVLIHNKKALTLIKALAYQSVLTFNQS